MPSWNEIVSFAFGLSILLHAWAFIWPNGKISERLHPSFPDTKVENLLRLQRAQIRLLNELVELERAKQRQPDPLQDLELVATVRRSPRRTQANPSLDGLRGPAL